MATFKVTRPVEVEADGIMCGWSCNFIGKAYVFDHQGNVGSSDKRRFCELFGRYLKKNTLHGPECFRCKDCLEAENVTNI